MINDVINRNMLKKKKITPVKYNYCKTHGDFVENIKCQ